MDFLATVGRRKLLFGLLYLSEGAPIGFIWLGMPTRLRAAEVPLDKIAWLMALLILPWTFKFLWAPVVDLLRGRRWGFKQWILTSQLFMAATLLPLMWLDIRTQFSVVAVWLLLHAFTAATQDISIDALCIQQSQPQERGALNGWMQCGVLVGRAAMGGGSLVLEHWIGFQAVVVLLIGLVMCSALLLAFAQETQWDLLTAATESKSQSTFSHRLTSMMLELLKAVRTGGIWIGLLCALIAPAAFKSLEAILGPFLIDRGYSELQIGQFTSTAMILGMIAGSLLAGWMANRIPAQRFVVQAMIFNLLAIASLAAGDMLAGHVEGWHLLVLLTLISVSIGCFTVALYQWLMNLTNRSLAATQFTAFMAATNACEAWSTGLFGTLQHWLGYPLSMLALCAISALAIPLLVANVERQPTSAAEEGK